MNPDKWLMQPDYEVAFFRAPSGVPLTRHERRILVLAVGRLDGALRLPLSCDPTVEFWNHLRDPE